MHQVKAQHSLSELLALSRQEEGRVSHRFLAIRDILLERSRSWVCEQYGITRETLRQWVAWYNRDGAEGLRDEARSGRPPRLTAAQEADFKARITAPPSLEKDGVGRWRAADIQRLLSEEYNIHYSSLSGVSALLHRLGMAWISGRPHNPRQEEGAVESFKKLHEELENENLAQKYPEKRIELWCQDESRIGQKGRRTHGWALKGSRPPVPIDTRYKNAYIFGAFCPERDAAVGLFLPWVNTEMMQLHLDEISRQLPEEVHAALIVDGARWHRSDALKVPENITLIRIPPHSPECNTAEKPWQFLKDNFLSHQVFQSYQDILDACQHAWNAMINEPGRIQSLTKMNHLLCQVS